MRDAYEEDLKRLAAAMPLSPPGQWRVMHRGDPRVVEAILSGLRNARAMDRYADLLGRLALLTRREPIAQRAAQPDVLRRLADDLLARRSTLRLEQFGLNDTIGEVLWAYRVVFALAGPAGLPVMRELLDGLPTESRHSKPKEDAVLGGVKSLALEAIGRHGTGDDVPRLQRFVENTAQPHRARAVAAVAWHGFVGAEAAETVVEQLVVSLGEVDNEVQFVEALAGVGADLVPWLLPLLSHEAFWVSHRAGELLVAIGAAAVPALSELLLDDPTPGLVRLVEALLERIDPKAVQRVHTWRQGQNRGLSRAVPEPTAERGLSRVPEERGDA